MGFSPDLGLAAKSAGKPLCLTSLCLPQLERAGRDRIVNVVSRSGKRVRNAFVGYNITKFAMIRLTSTISHVALETGMRATAICTSFLRTAIKLPNNSAMPEMLISCRLEDML